MLEFIAVTSIYIDFLGLMMIPALIVYRLVHKTKWFQRMFPSIEFDGEEW